MNFKDSEMKALSRMPFQLHVTIHIEKWSMFQSTTPCEIAQDNPEVELQLFFKKKQILYFGPLFHPHNEQKKNIGQSDNNKETSYLFYKTCIFIQKVFPRQPLKCYKIDLRWSTTSFFVNYSHYSVRQLCTIKKRM